MFFKWWNIRDRDWIDISTEIANIRGRVYERTAAYYCLITLQEFVIFRKQAKGCDEIG